MPLSAHARLSIFITHNIDNLDSTFQKNFSKKEFHGRVLGVTNHLSLDNLGVKCPPIEIKSSDKSHPRLPDSYVIHGTVVQENVVTEEADKDNPTCSPYSMLWGNQSGFALQ